MLHFSKFFFPVIIIFLVRFCFLGSSENTQPRKKKSTMSSMKVVAELDQDVELNKNCSPPKMVKKDLERFIFWGEFVKEDWEPESLFNLMERTAEYDVLNYIETLGLSAESIQEVLQHFEEIENYLLEQEYGAWDLAYPSRPILGRRGFMCCTMNSSPSTWRRRLISCSWGHETFDRSTLNWVTATYLNGL